MKSLFLLPFILLLTACSSLGGGSDATHFYSLSSMAESTTLSTGSLKLGIGPVRLPNYLKRPQVVTRINQNELKVAEPHQWAGSLKEEITQVLTDNLSVLIGTEQIEKYPWKRHYQPDHRIRVLIEQLDGELGKQVTLKARWWLRGRGTKTGLSAKKSLIKVKVKGADYNSYVAAQSQAIYKLSQEIAARIGSK